MKARDTIPVQMSLAVRSLTRPYQVSIAMVALMALVPAYIFIAEGVSQRAMHAPSIALDRMLPLVPAWALVYGALYLFLIVMPVFVVREQEHIRRTFLAYLAVWVTAEVIFIAYPTIAPRPEHVGGDGFVNWGLRFLYEADPPYNCFPSIHVAHSFVSALACYAVNRRVGVVATGAAFLVALSTLLTKQHYVADVVAGVGLAVVAWAVFLRGYVSGRVPARDRHAAPALALGAFGVSLVAVGVYWIAYGLRT